MENFRREIVIETEDIHREMVVEMEHFRVNLRPYIQRIDDWFEDMRADTLMGPMQRKLLGCPNVSYNYTLSEDISTEEDCIICKQPLSISSNKSEGCQAIRLEPCKHIVGRECFLAYVKHPNSSISENVRCPTGYCKASLQPAAESLTRRDYRTIISYIFSPFFIPGIMDDYLEWRLTIWPAMSMLERVSHGGLWAALLLTTWLLLMLGTCGICDSFASYAYSGGSEVLAVSYAEPLINSTFFGMILTGASGMAITASLLCLGRRMN